MNTNIEPERSAGLESRQERLARLRKGLAGAGVKLTHQRLEIFLSVADSDDHPDAEAIYKAVRRRVPTVSLDTVYRTLWMLVDLGLISTVGLPKDRVRFDGNVEPHHHFVCTRCGRTADFTCPAFDRLAIPDAVKAMGSVEGAQVEVRGVCPSCSGKKASINRAKRK